MQGRNAEAEECPELHRPEVRVILSILQGGKDRSGSMLAQLTSLQALWKDACASSCVQLPDAMQPLLQVWRPVWHMS